MNVAKEIEMDITREYSRPIGDIAKSICTCGGNVEYGLILNGLLFCKS